MTGTWKHPGKWHQLLLISLFLCQTALTQTQPPIVFTPHHFKLKNMLDTAGLFAGDLDQDQDVDLLAAVGASAHISWLENDGMFNYTRHTIEYPLDAAADIEMSDIDGDGDFDVVAVKMGTYPVYEGLVAWWENNGTQQFTRHDIDTDFRGARVVHVVDMDFDQDPDVLAGAWYWDTVAWYENDGHGHFTKHIIEEWLDGVTSLAAIDLDSDMDMDVIGTGERYDEVVWYENDGNMCFTEHIIDDTFDQPWEICGGDLDGDSDVDVVCAGMSENKVVWWENDGDENFRKHVLIRNYEDAHSVVITDMDQDGRPDIVCAKNAVRTPSVDDILWWRNNGDKTFTKNVIQDEFLLIDDLMTYDMDQDGDFDVICSDFLGTICWWESQPNVGVHLEMPAEIYHSGDQFSLQAILNNHSLSDQPDIALFILLEVEGEYWYWPSWSIDGDYRPVTIPVGKTTIEIIKPITWPDDAGQASGIKFWSAFVKENPPGILGAYDYVEFGWE